MNHYLLAFITGLTSGGISCIAVQGGLLASSISQNRGSNIKNVLFFLNSKLVAYTILGFLLGLLGSSFNIPLKVQGIFQIVIGIFMLATAARIINLHPIFRYTVLQPPKFMLRFLKKLSISGLAFTPIFLGALTVLIPCGVTQAMMLYAVGAGNSFGGAGIMFSFILGTFPIFLLFGLASTRIFKNKVLTIIAAFAIALIGLLSINTGQILRGSVHTFQNYWLVLTETSITNNSLLLIKGGAQEATITVSSFGYKSDTKTLKAGIPVKLKVITENELGCGRSFVIPSINYSKVLPATGITEITFTPDSVGILTYTCSMGMYTGSFNVVE